MIERIRGIFVLIEFTFTVSIVIILMYIFPNKNRTIRQIWAKMQLKILGITIQEHGDLDNNADMLLMNHQSIMDIVVFEALGDRDIAWVAKKEIANIPWFGHILKAPKMIIVERESKKSLIQLLKDAKDRISNNRQLAIFPEGTRSDGTYLRKFKSGAKMIAEKNELSVQPIIILGTHSVFQSKELKQSSGTVEIIYLPTVQAQKGTDWYDKLENDMKEAFDTYYKKSETK